MNRLIQLQMEGSLLPAAARRLIVERTDFISVPVTDMERSKQFYGETLGLEPVGTARSWASRSTSSARTSASTCST